MSDDDANRPHRVHVRKFGTGKSAARMTGPARFAAAAEEALNRAFTTRAVVDAARFRELMQGQGVPAEAVEAFLASLVIDDDSYLAEQRRE